MGSGSRGPSYLTPQVLALPPSGAFFSPMAAAAAAATATATAASAAVATFITSNQGLGPGLAILGPPGAETVP